MLSVIVIIIISQVGTVVVPTSLDWGRLNKSAHVKCLAPC